MHRLHAHFSSTKRFAASPEAPDASAKRRSAKIARSLDQAAAEMMLPDPVHHHARGERILTLAIHFASVMRCNAWGTFVTVKLQDGWFGMAGYRAEKARLDGSPG